jgi:hypothetical protein
MPAPQSLGEFQPKLSFLLLKKHAGKIFLAGSFCKGEIFSQAKAKGILEKSQHSRCFLAKNPARKLPKTFLRKTNQS